MWNLRAQIHEKKPEGRREDLLLLDLQSQERGGDDLCECKLERRQAGADFGPDTWNGGI